MDLSDYHIATKQIHELREQLRATEDLCQSLVKRIQEGMHWLPMTPDAVFEDGGKYLVAMVNANGCFIDKMAYADGNFWVNDDEWERIHFSHYARITEPK